MIENKPTSWIPPAPWAGLCIIIATAALIEPWLRAPVMAVACIGLAFVHLDLAVLLWIACASLAPLPLVQVRSSSIPLSTLVLSVFVMRALVARNFNWTPPRTRLTVPLLALAAAAVASGVTGALFPDPAVAGVHRYVLVQIYATGLILLSVATVFLLHDQLRTRWLITSAAWIMIVAGFLVALPRVDELSVIQRTRWFPIPISYAFAIVYAALLCRLPTQRWQWICGVVVLALVIEGPASNFLFDRSQWVSGWLMLGVPFLLLPILSFPRITLPLFAVAGLASIYWIWPFVMHAFEIARHEGDFTRLRIWQDALLMGSLRPLFGVGLGNYIDYAERYAQVDVALGSAHGNYQQIVAEMGLTGLGFVFWVLWRAFGVGWRLFRNASEPIYRAVGLGVIGGLAGQVAAAVLGDYLLPAYHNGGHYNISATIYTWMMLGVLLASERLAFATSDSNRAA